jgi:hypothetical protein
MPEISFITHKGVQILYENFENGKPDEILPWIEKAKPVIRSQPDKSILALVNVRGASLDMFDPSITAALKDYLKGNDPYIKCAAVYGVEAELMQVIFKTVKIFSGRKNVALAKTLEEAKEFLINYQE